MKTFNGKVEKWQTFFFLSGFSFTTIHKPQDCKGKGRAFQLLSTTSIRLTDIF